jgi:hypothetical protein
LASHVSRAASRGDNKNHLGFELAAERFQTIEVNCVAESFALFRQNNGDLFTTPHFLRVKCGQDCLPAIFGLNVENAYV